MSGNGKTDFDITKYSIVRQDGLWLIGIVDGRVLKSALEISVRAAVEAGALNIQYQCVPLMMMPEADEYPLNAARHWPVSEMPESRRKQLSECVKVGEDIRRQMSMQAGTSLHLVKEMPKGIGRT